MSYNPNQRWTDAVSRDVQAPVYVLALDGIDRVFATKARVPAAGPWGTDALGGEGAFEAWTGAIPDGWATNLGAGTVVENTTDQRSGSKCAEYQRTVNAYGDMTYDLGALKAGKWHTVVIHAKTSAAMSAGLRVIVRNLTANEDVESDGETWSAPSQNLLEAATETSYRAYVVTFKTDAGFADTDTYRLFLPVTGVTLNEEIFWDDVTLWKESSDQYALNVMEIPSGGRVEADPIEGERTVQDIRATLYDDDGIMTSIVATDADGAAVSTLINRRARIFQGFTEIDVSDFAVVETRNITGLKMTRDMLGYEFDLEDLLSQLDCEIMTAATEARPSIIKGNVVNVLFALLTGTFSTGHATFPLDYVSAGDVLPTGNTTFGSDSAFTNPANARDGDSTTFATAGAAPSSIVLTFAAGTESGRPTISAKVAASGDTMDLYYSIDGGANWTKFATVESTDVTEYAAPILNDVDMSSFRLRATVPTGGGSNAQVRTSHLANSAPTGCGLAESEIDSAGLVAERDTWHPNDKVRPRFTEPEAARALLQEEMYRAFQCFPVVKASGLVGVKFLTPSFPPSAVAELTEADMAAPARWQREFGDHLNRFRFSGDWDPIDGEFDTELVSADSAADTTDQGDTGETIEYRIESRWLASDLEGAEIARELSARMRSRYLKTPARIVIPAVFTKRAIEAGDVILVTDTQIPDLFSGSRGLTKSAMTIVAVRPEFESGTIELTMLDSGFKRYGVIAPSAKTGDFSTASDEDKNTFFFISDTNGQMGDGSAGYRLY